MLENKKNLVFGGIVALIGTGLVFYVYLSRPVGDIESAPDTGVEQNSELTPVPTPRSDSAGSPQPAPSPTEEPFSGLHGIKSPATCQVGGEVDFYDKGAFSSKDSKISWQNVDSQGRLINWRVSPQDDLAIGPNIFANLEVPDGEYENLTIHLPENPVSKNYFLTASITYGQIIQDDVKIREADCSGQVQVNLNF